MDADPEVDAAVLVVVGRFNPAIFHPSWLALQGLVPAKEAEKAEVAVIASELADFRCGAVQVQVTQQRLAVTALERASVPVARDLVLGVLSVLEHTPVTKCGINRLLHFRAVSTEAWHRIGHTVVQKDLFRDVIDDPGTLSVSILGKRPGTASALRLKIEPSVQVTPGVFFDFNENYDQPEGNTSAQFARDVLDEHWEAAQAHFLHAARTVLGRTAERP